MRGLVVGTAPHGASSRGTRRPTADTLSTLGAYSIVRHPLYVANTLVALGCAMLSGTWYLPLIVVLLSFIYHERIAAREEAFLQTTFGDSFRAWAGEVPAMIPAFGRYRRPGVPFQTRKVLDAGIARAVRDRDGISGARHTRRFRPYRRGSIWIGDGCSCSGIDGAVADRGRFPKGWGLTESTNMMERNTMTKSRVRLGFRALLASGALKNKRVGVVSNPASIDAHYRHVVRAIASEPGVTLAAIFGPQHGYRADVQDNMIETAHAHDPTRGVPVYSLYSETREPTAEMLKGLDALVIDLQDVGSRIYTFIYTMANCLRAGRKHGVPVIVTDRPNPIGGEEIGGPMLDEGIRIVRRTVSDPDAPRHDDRGAGEIFQRAHAASAPT